MLFLIPENLGEPLARGMTGLGKDVVIGWALVNTKRNQRERRG